MSFDRKEEDDAKKDDHALPQILNSQQISFLFLAFMAGFLTQRF